MKKQLLISAMLIGGACAAWAAEPGIMTSSPYQGTTIENGDTYYLYNVETGTWLDINDQIPHQWPATGVLNKIGFDITLNKPDGYAGYTIFCNTTGNGMLRGMDAGPEFQFGLDGNDDVPTDWIIESKTGSAIPNAYTIRVEALDGAISEAYYLGAAWDEDLNLYKLYRDTEDGYATWQFVTREERLKHMVEEAKANPDGVDATWLIPNHNMATSNLRDDKCWKGTTGWGGWTSWENINNVCGGDYRGLISRELWQGTIDKYTVIENLPEGSYAYSVSGFYREGSPWATQKVEGPFDNKAWYYAGGSSALFMNVFDNAQSEENKSMGFTEMVGGKYFAGYGAGIAFIHGYFNNTPVVTNVSADGKLVLGLWKSETIREDSFNFKQMHLTYKATKADEDLTPLKDRINALIAEGESYGNLEGLAEAISAAKASLNGTGSDMMAAIRPLGDVVGTARKYAQFADIFNRTKALCPAGTDVSKAQALYDAAASDDDFRNAIQVLRGIRRRAMSTRIPDIFTGTSTITGGEMFYLYNVGQQQFMDGGGEWSGHPILDIPGTEFTPFEVDGLKCKLATNFIANGADHYFAAWGSFDASEGNAAQWEFVPIEGQENVFYMRDNYVANKDCVVYQDRTPGALDGELCERALFYYVAENNLDKTDPNGWWKIITKEERDALLQTASLDNPVDASYKIVNPGFNRILSPINPDAWSQSGADFTMGQHGNHIGETAEASNIVQGEFELFQEIPAGELPYGVYVIECNGYYRDGDLNAQADREPVTPVSFFTNDPEASVQICNILDGANQAPGEGKTITSKDGKTYEVPENYLQSIAFYRSGVYKNQIVTNFQKNPDDIEDPGLWLGLEYPSDADEPNTGAYVNVDDFRIKYYGNNTTVEAVKEAINSGVNDIVIDESAAAATDNRIFNLQGIQVANPTAPGIYICNGKKFVVR